MRAFPDVPVLCGHRGSGRGIVGDHRENTLGSFRAAVAAGLRWVEVDARLTADGVLVACHDPVVAGDRPVSRLTAPEADGLGLLRVADLLEDLPPDVGVDVDVKTSLDDALRARERTTAARVAALMAREAARRPLLATSFDAGAVSILRALLPAVPVGLLTWGRFPLRKAIPAAVHLGADVVGPRVASFGLPPHDPDPRERPIAETVGVAHAAGLQVLVWDPRPGDAAALLEAGVDCLVVDVPAAWPPPARRERRRRAELRVSCE